MSKTKKKKVNEDIPETTAEEILALPDWNEDACIYNYVRIFKNIEDKKQEYILRVWIEDKEVHYRTDDAICLPPDTPMSSTCFQEIFQQGKLPEISIKELFYDLKERQSQYVYVQDDIHLTTLALKSLASFFLEVFHSVPYSDIFSPEYGSGKTTLMEVAVWSSYHGIVNTDPTAAVLYRIMADVRCTIGIDEIDNLFKNKNANPNIISIVNSSNVKGIPVLRINMEKGGKVEPFDAYGIKYFTRVGTNIPPAWISRADPIPMLENRGRKDLKKYPNTKAFQDLRDKGYILRWTLMEKIRSTYQELIDDRILVDRNGDIYLPMLTIAKLVGKDVYQAVLNYAEDQWKKSSLRSKDIYKEMLVRILWEQGFRNEVKVIDIRNAFNDQLRNEGLLGKDRHGNYKDYHSRTVIKLLESFRFERSLKNTGHNVHFNINPKNLEEIVQIYHIKKEPSSEESEDSEDRFPTKGVKNEGVETKQSSLDKLSSIQEIEALVLKWIDNSKKGSIDRKTTLEKLVEKGHNQNVVVKVLDNMLKKVILFEPRPGVLVRP